MSVFNSLPVIKLEREREKKKKTFLRIRKNSRRPTFLKRLLFVPQSGRAMCISRSGKPFREDTLFSLNQEKSSLGS